METLRTAHIVLLVALLVSGSVRAQTPAASTDFTLSAVILALRIPTNAGNADGTPMTTGSVLWAVIKNETTTPYSLCTAATGLSTAGRGGMSGTDHCSPFWIVLPGETHFQAMNGSVPIDPSTTLGLNVILQGKPLGSTENLATWTLAWQGTVREALAAGEKITAIARH